ncbi:MAG: hypothetical protein HQ508_05825 [Candidatus Marinimicrobia bacterium]|nr:hypothetical protein [Candidatus Neomarinimicrobiota bacterium]
MADYHPFFVHFPIAILLVAAVFDLFGVLRQHEQSTSTAFYLLLMAGISALLAAISGNLAETAIHKQELLSLAVAETFGNHVSMGNATTWIIVIVVLGRSFAVLEKKKWAARGWVFPSISLLLAALVLVTGLLGGALSQEILRHFMQN